MGSKNPKMRGKAGGTKAANMKKGDAKTGVRVVQAVASGGKSEVTRAVKKRLAKAGGGKIDGNKAARREYAKGGYGRQKLKDGGMPKAKPC